VSTIGIICPYRAQATLIQKLVEKELKNEQVKVHVGTIHGFQGDECDLIICLFNSSLRIPQSSNLFLNKLNIINVAISRARDRLVIIMPDDSTEGIENLTTLNRLVSISKQQNGNLTTFSSEDIEETLWHSRSYIKDRTFVTGHHEVNVYGASTHPYHVRAEDRALDIQINKVN
jgi:superfamily I DNA and/or RNA helicase